VPSYRARAYICPAKNGEPVSIVDFPPWWRRIEFYNQYGQRQIDSLNPWYVDYGYLLAAAEATAWNRQEWSLFAADPRSREDSVVEAMHLWEELLAGASWVVVELYEWESGYD
jgi:hypothetical protein